MSEFFIRFGEAERMPRGYGFCYRDVLLEQKVCCPIPFNWLVPRLIRFYWRLVEGPSVNWQLWKLTREEADAVRAMRQDTDNP